MINRLGNLVNMVYNVIDVKCINIHLPIVHCIELVEIVVRIIVEDRYSFVARVASHIFCHAYSINK